MTNAHCIGLHNPETLTFEITFCDFNLLSIHFFQLRIYGECCVFLPFLFGMALINGK